MPVSSEIHAKRLTRAVWVIIAVAIFVADQVTKALIEASIPEHSTVPVLPHFLNLVHTNNAGAAFGLFSESPSPWKTLLLVVVSSLLLAMVVGIMWRHHQLRWEAGVGLALILGGALSNLFDRIRFGRVVDFVDVYFRSYHWYTFNFADASIVVGAGFLVFQLLFVE